MKIHHRLHNVTQKLPVHRAHLVHAKNEVFHKTRSYLPVVMGVLGVVGGFLANAYVPQIADDNTRKFVSTVIGSIVGFGSGLALHLVHRHRFRKELDHHLDEAESLAKHLRKELGPTERIVERRILAIHERVGELKGIQSNLSRSTHEDLPILPTLEIESEACAKVNKHLKLLEVEALDLVRKSKRIEVEVRREGSGWTAEQKRSTAQMKMARELRDHAKEWLRYSDKAERAAHLLVQIERGRTLLHKEEREIERLEAKSRKWFKDDGCATDDFNKFAERERLARARGLEAEAKAVFGRIGKLHAHLGGLQTEIEFLLDQIIHLAEAKQPHIHKLNEETAPEAEQMLPDFDQANAIDEISDLEGKETAGSDDFDPGDVLLEGWDDEMSANEVAEPKPPLADRMETGKTAPSASEQVEPHSEKASASEDKQDHEKVEKT